MLFLLLMYCLLVVFACSAAIYYVKQFRGDIKEYVQRNTDDNDRLREEWKEWIEELKILLNTHIVVDVEEIKKEELSKEVKEAVEALYKTGQKIEM